MNNIPCVLSIAGTDPSGGAGISADIKAISATGGYAASVITALVAQNTQGVQSILEIPPAFVSQQLESVFNDLTIAAVKIGMLHEKQIIDAVVDALIRFQPAIIVFDPVMVAKDGSILLDLKTISLLKKELIPRVTLITPNLFEASHLLETEIKTTQQMEVAANTLGRHYQVNVLIKGGHLEDTASADLLYSIHDNTCHWFTAKRIHTKNTHGTGCSLSAAIASYLAQNFSLLEAVGQAKQYISHAIQSGSMQTIGKGNGPVDHFYFLENRTSRLKK
ncbi:MAG: bifunctional hydroxymethylpyrimidine kinase/phosphomethylpyrimidine kinase [Legionellales bacterium RIFCSPHIGHO2_12_FULL_42_9]|nr:MAG: bifunctional hydroxymethylpyrimidine kinase/phosphomethylpyrimidine kinase [Legionellales bacterium RIFCSPHIGHO2_12_FULL_42_9]